MTDDQSEPQTTFRPEHPTPIGEGALLGHFRIRRSIGRGGMGEVFLAHDEHLDREVALKVLAPTAMNHPDARRRFRREAYALSRLSHPNIATIFDFDTQDGVDFLVMEFVEGENLAERMKQVRVSEAQTLDFGSQICATLVEAHAHGVLHRDLTPRNIMITEQGTVKVLDFGLAKLLNPTSDANAPTETVSVTRQIAGTVPYISPERLRGRPADERADIYALGAILYEMATGHRVFEAVTRAELIAATLDHEPRSVRQLASSISPDLERTILKALDKDPGRRYQTARDLAVDLQRARQPIALKGPAASIPKRIARLLLLMAAIAAVIVLLDGRRTESLDDVEMIALVTGPDPEGSSRISPDGQWISYQSTAAGKIAIWALPITGGDPRLVASGTTGLISHVWSQDSRRIALVVRAGEAPFLQIVPAFGGPPEQTIALPHELRLGSPVAWAGTSVYLDASFDGLWRVDLDTGETGRILPGQGPEGRRFEFDVCDDAHRVVYTVREPDRFALWVADLRGGEPRRLTHHDRSDLRPRWTGPQCRYVVHSSNRTGQSDLWRTALDGRSVRLTFSGDIEYAESGSREGRLLSYRQEVGRSDLWIVDPHRTESGSTRLTADTLDDLWPSSAVHSDRIAFQRRARSIDEFDPVFQSQILVASLHSGVMSGMRTIAARGGLVQLSPDGRWLAYAQSSEDRKPSLVLGDLEGGRLQTVDQDLAVPVFGNEPFGPLWSNVHWSEATGELVYLVDGPASQQVRRLEPGFDSTPRIAAESSDGILRQPRISADGDRMVYVLEREASADGSPEAEASGPRIQTELRERSFSSGREVVLFSETSDASVLVRLIGQRSAGPWLLLRTGDPSSPEAETEILEIDRGGSVQLIESIRGQVGSCTLDRAADILYLNWVPEDELAQNLFALDLAAGSRRRVTENESENTWFSQTELLRDGWLLYTRHESNSDIWLIRFEP